MNPEDEFRRLLAALIGMFGLGLVGTGVMPLLASGVNAQVRVLAYAFIAAGAACAAYALVNIRRRP